MIDLAEVINTSKSVLEQNNRGSYTIPADNLYPHQWLWDSCFIAIGLSHYDVERAKTEVLSLLRGQWSNGMLPHMIFGDSDQYNKDRERWRSRINPYAPDTVATSGITQPPMLAEAVVKIGKGLPVNERRTWYQTVYPALIAYHSWHYQERDPHDENLVVQIHPWETGLDNTPPWINELHSHLMPDWIRIIKTIHLDTLITKFRRDARHVPPDQRLTTIDALAFYSTQRRLRRKSYDIDRVLPHSMFAIEDLTYNCILIRANKHLKNIAKAINKTIPENLKVKMDKHSESLDLLWDAYSAQYYSRNFVTHRLLKVPSIAALMPLYSGAISKERAEQLVNLLLNKEKYLSAFPIPTVPLDSDYFNATCYWQGPSWVNTNWLIIDGLNRYGYKDIANQLAYKTVELVNEHGCYEYFSPIDGTPAGIQNFSWTAALVIDLINTYAKP